MKHAAEALFIYHSKINEIANIIIDMKTPFSLSGFALRGNAQCNALVPYSFKGCNDNKAWILLKYNSNEYLRENYNWHNYTVPKSRYRYYGIFQDPDPSIANWKDNYYFSLSGIDFIKANTNERGKGSCKRVSLFKMHVLIYIFITKL